MFRNESPPSNIWSNLILLPDLTSVFFCLSSTHTVGYSLNRSSVPMCEGVWRSRTTMFHETEEKVYLGKCEFPTLMFVSWTRMLWLGGNVVCCTRLILFHFFNTGIILQIQHTWFGVERFCCRRRAYIKVYRKLCSIWAQEDTDVHWAERKIGR